MNKEIKIILALLIAVPVIAAAQVIFPNRGGTGVSDAPGQDQILIGNGSAYDLLTLTAGDNISIATTSGALTLTASIPGGGLSSADIDTYTELDTLVADVTLAHTGLFDTEAELESLLGDVSNVFTNTDGSLADDDLSNNDTDDLLEGASNLYFSNARVSSYLTGGTGITESGGTLSFDCSEVEGVGINCVGEAITLDTITLSGDLSGTGTAAIVASIAAGAVADAELDYTAVTLADFTNDAGYLTTVDISNDTNLAGDSEIVLTGDTLSIASTIARDTELHSAVTLAGQDYLGIAGQVITAGAINADDLGTGSFGDWSCNGTTCSLDTGTVGDNELDYTSLTLNDLTFDVGSVSKTEFGYLNGVTSAIQTQLNTKLETVDISNDTNLAAGRSLTLTGDSVAADAELYTESFSIILSAATTTDSGKAQHIPNTAITITEVECSTDTGTVTIQLDERTATTPNTGGTDVMTSALVCDDNQQTTSSFTNAGIAAGAVINLDIDAISAGTPATRIHVHYTIDD